MADELKPCRACGNDCRVERFEGHAIEGVMTIYMCANSTKFGGDCPDPHAYLNVNAWNHRIEPEAADRALDMCKHGADRGSYCGYCGGYSKGGQS